MGTAAVMIGMAALGALSGAQKASAQKKAAREAAKQRPYSETTTTSPVSWIDQYLRQGAEDANQNYQSFQSNPWASAPPTFNDVASGRFQSGYSPTLSGPMPTPAVREEARALGEEYGPERENRRLAQWYVNNGFEVPARFQQFAQSGGAAQPGGGGMGMGGGGNGGAGGGMGAGGGSWRGARDQLANFMTQRAMQGIDPTIQTAIGSVGNIASNGYQNPWADRAMDMSQQVFGQSMAPDSSLNQWIGRGMAGQTNQATPYYHDWLGKYMDAPSLPQTSYLNDVWGMATGSGRLFDIRPYNEQ